MAKHQDLRENEVCKLCKMDKGQCEFSRNQWKKRRNAKCIQCLGSSSNAQNKLFRSDASKKKSRFKYEPLSKEDCNSFLCEQLEKIFDFPANSSLTNSISSIISSFMYLRFSGVYTYKQRNDLFEIETHCIRISDNYSYQWTHQCVLDGPEHIVSESWNRSGSISIISSDEHKGETIVFIPKGRGIRPTVTAQIKTNEYGKNGVLEIKEQINGNKIWLIMKQQQ